MFGFGIDVGESQGTINWNKFKSDGVKFAIIRTFIGSHNDGDTPATNDQFDPTWQTNYYGAHNVGIYVQPYMLSYARDIGVPGYDQLARAEREADDVIYWYSQNAIEGVRKICWWDIEAQEISTWGTPAFILQKMQAIKAKLDTAGIEMGIYTSYSTWNSHFYDSWYETSGIHKWCAIYPDGTTENPPYNNVIENWRNGAWAIHQYSSLGLLDGCREHVDLDMATTEDVFADTGGEDEESYNPIPDEWDEDLSGNVPILLDNRRPVAFAGDGSFDGVINARDVLYRDMIKYRDDWGIPRDPAIYNDVVPFKARYDFAYSPTKEEMLDHLNARGTINGSMLAAGLQDV